jgi:hypothetical protein
MTTATTTTTTTTTTKSNKKAKLQKNKPKKKKKKKCNEKAAIHLVGDEPIVNPFFSFNQFLQTHAGSCCLPSSCSQVFKKSLKNSFSILVQNSDISPPPPPRPRDLYQVSHYLQHRVFS